MNSTTQGGDSSSYTSPTERQVERSEGSTIRFPNHISFYRHRCELSQEKAGFRTRAGPAHFGRLERGEYVPKATTLRAVARVLGPRAETVRFVRAEVTDRGSYYVAVNADDVDLGNGIPDLHRMGWHLTNSEVGAAALRIFEYVLRLVCSNGLVMSVARKLFYRVHRATQDESIDRDLAYAMTLLPERWEQSTRALRAARHDRVSDPEETLRGLFEDRTDVRSHTDAVLAAFRDEPEPTRFGLVQAITRAAQNVGAEGRLALETLAGEIVVNAFPTTPPAPPIVAFAPPAALPAAPRVIEAVA